MSRFGKSPSPLAIVVAGIATGAIGWLPLVWLLAPRLATVLPSTHALSVLPSVTATTDTRIRSSAERVEDQTAMLPHGLPGGGLPVLKAELRGNAAEDSAESRSPIVTPASFERRPEGVDSAAEDEVETEAGVVNSPALMRVGEEGELQPIVPPESGRVAIREQTVLSSPSQPASLPSTRLSVDETDTVRLMHDLHSEDNEVRSAAAAELATRGYTEQHLDLARQLTSAKTDIRAALASKLPGTLGIDARLWLTWLMRDEDAEVRLAAIGVLATTGDSDSLRRAMEIARQDRDPRVRKLLDQFEKQQKASR